MVRVVIADDSQLVYSDDYRDGFEWGFRALGCDVKVVNIKTLRGLARMQPSITSMRSTMPKALAQAIVKMRPDVVWCYHGRTASVDTFLQGIKKCGAKTATYLPDEPYETGASSYFSQKYDYVFTLDPCTIEVHRLSRQSRRNVYYLPAGVNTDRFKQLPYFDKGTSELRRKIPAFFLGNATLVPRPAWLKPVENTVSGSVIRYWKPTPKGHKDWIPLEAHPKAYGSCLVGLNVHRAPWMDRQCYENRVKTRRGLPKKPPAGLQIHTEPPPKGWGTGFWNEGNLPAAHWNPRFIEMAACGTCVVSDDHRTEIAREFPFAPQASSPEQFLELVHYYISHPEEAEEIGRACCYRISRRHTYIHRAAEVLIRLGFKDALAEEVLSSLGEPADWLTPQDFKELTEKSFSGQTGLSGLWSPQSGMSSIKGFGSRSGTDSIDPPLPWYC